MSTFETRTGLASPQPPASLVKLWKSSTLADVLFELDAESNSETWKNAFDVGDHFGWNLTGEHEVQRFATQGTGSIFGLLIGSRVHTAEELEAVPVVFVDSEGSLARVAWSLKDFWSVIASLHPFGPDVICRVGNDSSVELDGTSIEDLKSNTKANLTKWLKEGPSKPEDLDAFVDCLSLDQRSPDNSVDYIFECDFTLPRFRPQNLEDLS